MTKGNPKFEEHEECRVLTQVMRQVRLEAQSGRPVRQFAAGDRILSPTDSPDAVYWVKSGRVQLLEVDERGVESEIGAIEGGGWFGEVCFCQYRSGLHDVIAFAGRATEVVEVRFDEFTEWVQADRQGVNRLLEQLCRSVALEQRREKRMRLSDGRERLVSLLLDLARPLAAGEEIRMSHEELAAEAGLSRPFVSVAMGELRELGLVNYRRKGPMVVDQDALAVHLRELRESR